jgi:formylglycine-generating enzyme required for sulfatase activity
LFPAACSAWVRTTIIPKKHPAIASPVDSFWIDAAPVTNRQFRRFANETGYVTFAEIKPDARDYPGALPHMDRTSVRRTTAAAPGQLHVAPNRWIRQRVTSDFAV